MAWLEKRGRSYWICWRDENGERQRQNASRDKAVAKAKLGEFETARMRGEKYGNPYEEHNARPLLEHITEYEADLKAKGRDTMYIYTIGKRLRKLIDACGWKALPDISVDSFCRWREVPIEQRQVEGKDKAIGPRTLNQYLEAVRAFCRWCVKRKRMPSNPMVDAEKVEESGDIRRVRRALTEEELVRLFKQLSNEHKPVYRFILATGLRRQEVEDLLWGDVHLDAPLPFLKLRAAATKARRADTLPLRADVVKDLRGLRGEAGDTDKVFTAVPTIAEHREYLALAKIEWMDDEGRRVDIHAMRHTYGTLLSKSGAAPRVTMELMRHSDIKLTMNVYTDPRIFDLAGAVERLPLPPEKGEAKARATGTAGTEPVVGADLGARATLSRQNRASCGNEKASGDRDVTADAAGNWQKENPSGKDGSVMRHLGLEPLLLVAFLAQK